MALNAASHNATGEPTGSVSGPAPPMSDDLTNAIQDSAAKDVSGQSEGGKDKHGNNEGQHVMGEAGKEKILEETIKDSGGGS